MSQRANCYCGNEVGVLREFLERERGRRAAAFPTGFSQRTEQLKDVDAALRALVKVEHALATGVEQTGLHLG